jgi:hypothetical protein
MIVKLEITFATGFPEGARQNLGSTARYRALWQCRTARRDVRASFAEQPDMGAARHRFKAKKMNCLIWQPIKRMFF